MTDFKLYGTCEGCKKKKFFIGKRTINIANAGLAKSQKLLCAKCVRPFKRK